MRYSLITVAIFVLAALSRPQAACAQAYHNPATGSAERKAILNAIRTPVEKFLGQPVIFVVTFIRSQSGWAMMEGIPEQPNGAQINWDKTKWAAASDHGAWGGGVDALVHKKGGKWVVVTYVVGASDVEYIDWPQKYGCPKAICHLGGGN